MSVEDMSLGHLKAYLAYAGKLVLSATDKYNEILNEIEKREANEANSKAQD